MEVQAQASFQSGRSEEKENFAERQTKVPNEIMRKPSRAVMAGKNQNSKTRKRQVSNSGSLGSSSRAQMQHSQRHFVKHEYHDHAQDPDDGNNYAVSEDGLKNLGKGRKPADRPPRARGGVTIPFPIKLHRMLESIEKDGLAYIVSWQSHGRAFLVRKPKEFVEKVMPKYFRQTKITSFQRQLNLYGFRRITKGRDMGAYYHELFLCGKPFLASKMIRTKIKGTGFKAASSPDTEPNFYNMTPVVLHANVENTVSSEKVEGEASDDSAEMNAPGTPVMEKNEQEATCDIAPLPPAVLVTPDVREMSVISPISAIDPIEPLFETVDKEKVSPCGSEAEEDESRQDVIMFEGQRFHYLDSSDLLKAQPSSLEESPVSFIPSNLFTPILDGECNNSFSGPICGPI